MTRVGIIGAGRIGSALAQGLVDRGYEIVISNSRGPETLTELVDTLGPRATAGTPEQAAESGEWVIVTVPLRAIDTVPVGPLAGKFVLDTNNYYWERDGHIVELDEKRVTTSQLLQRHLPDAKVAKAFNHIVAAQILTDGEPAGTSRRRALATASDSPEAARFVTDLYDAFGYDTVDIGSLAESWRVERDTPAYGVRQDADELRANLAAAQR
ncbi:MULTISPECIES: NADPH-dependent F420 reductase [unclassified Microbacterium]|uniref:NADPH-dependent F420 reductase n=1 Tax=unclassified Microbacterium TaxID=2609290 RepID=UPI000C2C0E58|nr:MULTISPECIES: NAD(P)-binding domain-containing protein [unclassified Microbacterium]